MRSARSDGAGDRPAAGARSALSARGSAAAASSTPRPRTPPPPTTSGAAAGRDSYASRPSARLAQKSGWGNSGSMTKGKGRTAFARAYARGDVGRYVFVEARHARSAPPPTRHAAPRKRLSSRLRIRSPANLLSAWPRARPTRRYFSLNHGSIRHQLDWRTAPAELATADYDMLLPLCVEGLCEVTSRLKNRANTSVSRVLRGSAPRERARVAARGVASTFFFARPHAARRRELFLSSARASFAVL